MAHLGAYGQRLVGDVIVPCLAARHDQQRRDLELVEQQLRLTGPCEVEEVKARKLLRDAMSTEREELDLATERRRFRRHHEALRSAETGETETRGLVLAQEKQSFSESVVPVFEVLLGAAIGGIMARETQRRDALEADNDSCRSLISRGYLAVAHAVWLCLRDECKERERLTREYLALRGDIRRAMLAEMEEIQNRAKNAERLQQLDEKMRAVGKPFVGMSLVEKHATVRGVVCVRLAVETLYVDGPAHRAGINIGDIVSRVGEVDVTSLAHVRNVLARAKVGTKVHVVGQRGSRRGGAVLSTMGRLSSAGTDDVDDDGTASVTSGRSTVTGSAAAAAKPAISATASSRTNNNNNHLLTVPGAAGSPRAQRKTSGGDLVSERSQSALSLKSHGGSSSQSAAGGGGAAPDVYEADVEVMTSDAAFAELHRYYFDPSKHEKLTASSGGVSSAANHRDLSVVESMANFVAFKSS